ncbi:C-type lectin-like isoform X2 [Pelodiscus sinensis]|uniref:C-type lectin-like isoform X2 n=1 Tax=Pelodiscus sinensis TaxID=13735 RepID=UPI003F6AA2AC
MGPVAFVTLCLLGCLVCSPALAGTQAGSCPQGWKSHQGNCYGYFTEAKSWKEAQAACRQYWQGANLVSILNKEENDMLAGYVKQHKEKSKHVWIGLSDPSEDQSWAWTDQSLFNYHQWDMAASQPDNPKRPEHCVVLKESEFNRWHDYPCEEKFSFICEHGSCGP